MEDANALNTPPPPTSVIFPSITPRTPHTRKATTTLTPETIVHQQHPMIKIYRQPLKFTDLPPTVWPVAAEPQAVEESIEEGGESALRR